MFHRLFSILLMPMRGFARLADPEVWAELSTELTRASPVLIPVYYFCFDRLNHIHLCKEPLDSVLNALLAVDATMLVFILWLTMEDLYEGWNDRG